MKFRKYAAIALAGAMCMSLLAGCGDKKDDTFETEWCIP